MNDSLLGSIGERGPHGIRVPPGIRIGYDEIETHDVASFLHSARILIPDFGTRVTWYRGHADAGWALLPSVFRSYDPIAERNMLSRFMLGAPTRYQGAPSFSDWPEWLSLAQHYGLPTRLLDWSASPLTGLYFALQHEPFKPGPAALWALVPSLLNYSMIQSTVISLLGSPEVEPFIFAAFGLGPQVEMGKAVAAMGTEVDIRLAVQQGAFTIHSGLTPLDQYPFRRGILFKFVIPEAAKESFRLELRSLGIRRSSLFPDLSNLARQIAEEQLLYP